jgi:hypothetical protein
VGGAPAAVEGERGGTSASTSSSALAMAHAAATERRTVVCNGAAAST